MSENQGVQAAGPACGLPPPEIGVCGGATTTFNPTVVDEITLRDVFRFGLGAGMGGLVSLSGVRLPFPVFFVGGAGLLGTALLREVFDEDSSSAFLTGMGASIFAAGFLWRASTNGIGMGMGGLLLGGGGLVITGLSALGLWQTRDKS